MIRTIYLTPIVTYKDYTKIPNLTNILNVKAWKCVCNLFKPDFLGRFWYGDSCHLGLTYMLFLSDFIKGSNFLVAIVI